MPSRRGVLRAGAAGLTALFAGCSGNDVGAPTPTLTPAPTLTFAPTDSPTRTPTERPTEHYQTGHGRSVRISVTATDAESVATGVLRGDASLRRFERELVEMAVAEGTATLTAASFDPLEPRVYVERDGRYLRLDRAVTDRREVPAQELEIEAITTCGDHRQTVSEEPVPYDELSPEDRRGFTLGLFEHYDRDHCFGAGLRRFYDENALERSRFVNGSPTFVRFLDDTYRVRHEGTQRTTLQTFEFQATTLGESLAEFADAVVPEVVWTADPAALPEAERSFLAELVETGTYSGTAPIPERVDALLGRIRENAYPGYRSRRRFIRYDGRLYAVRTSESVA